jgi:hypothetical protein
MPSERTPAVGRHSRHGGRGDDDGVQPPGGEVTRVMLAAFHDFSI